MKILLKIIVPSYGYSSETMYTLQNPDATVSNLQLLLIKQRYKRKLHTCHSILLPEYLSPDNLKGWLVFYEGQSCKLAPTVGTQALFFGMVLLDLVEKTLDKLPFSTLEIG